MLLAPPGAPRHNDQPSCRLFTQPPCFVASIAPADGGARIPEFALAPNLHDLLSLTNEPPARTMAVLASRVAVAS